MTTHLASLNNFCQIIAWIRFVFKPLWFYHVKFGNFFSCKMVNHMLTKLYFTLRLCRPLTLQSKDKGVLGVTPELPLRLMNRKEPKG
jgi:hypothetical protein